MGEINKPEPVKLFVGILSLTSTYIEKAIKELKKLYGEIDWQSEIWEFTQTNYYKKEMGENLLRTFIAFDELIDPGDLSEIKIVTNKLEEEMTNSNVFRPINLDPGYLCLSKVILATTKDYNHRIYLGNGIYAEITLHYQKKDFIPWQWTYPDYRTKHYKEFFISLRSVYQQQLKRLSNQ